MAKTILFLHGWGGSSERHWQNILAKKLAYCLPKQTCKVIFPALPNADFPHLGEWMKALEGVLDVSGFMHGERNFGKLKVATHSLGGALWLHFVKRHPEAKRAQVFLVAPPLNDCGIDEIKDFFPLPNVEFDGERPLLVYSDNDPFIPLKDFEEFAKRYKMPVHFIPNAGHFGSQSGYGKWKWMEEKLN